MAPTARALRQSPPSPASSVSPSLTTPKPVARSEAPRNTPNCWTVVHGPPANAKVSSRRDTIQPTARPDPPTQPRHRPPTPHACAVCPRPSLLTLCCRRTGEQTLRAPSTSLFSRQLVASTWAPSERLSAIAARLLYCILPCHPCRLHSPGRIAHSLDHQA